MNDQDQAGVEDEDGEITPETKRRIKIATDFLREVTIFMLGVALGALWHWYSVNAPVTTEAHLIVILLIIILCMARYINLTRN